MIVSLGVGDTLQLYMGGGDNKNSGQIYYTTLCVSLTTPDMV